MTVTIDSLLQPYQRFGVHLGLERIKTLLANLGNPQSRVPIIHVAGTNGKGSVCAYLSSVLTEAGYKVGRYTSPHLVDWTERICINEQPISSEGLQDLLLQISARIDPTTESPTLFEVVTAAAWLYFAQQEVDIAIMEVGLGGRLDATNVCESPLVTAITSISREHWQQLGSTLAEIATQKAGILKRECPAVIGQLPLEAKDVVSQRLQELNCPAVWVSPAKEVKKEDATNPRWVSYSFDSQEIEYPLPLLGDVQLINSAIALSCLHILQQKGWNISLSAIQAGMAKTRWLGRLQWMRWNESKFLIDGAHNPAAAKSLRQYVDTLNTSVTWVMGMLSTKEHDEIFKALLRPGDNLYLVPVPNHSSADPQELATLVQNLCTDLADCQVFPHVLNALERGKEIQDYPVILCGSLYLIGHFLKNKSEMKS